MCQVLAKRVEFPFPKLLLTTGSVGSRVYVCCVGAEQGGDAVNVVNKVPTGTTPQGV